MTKMPPDWTHPEIVLWEIRKSGMTVITKPKDRLKRNEDKNKAMLLTPIKQEVGNIQTELWASDGSSLSFGLGFHVRWPPSSQSLS